MPSTNEYRPRITVDVDEAFYNRYKKVIPWGVGGKLINLVLEELITSIETHGQPLLASLLAKTIKLDSTSKSLTEAKEETNGNNS